MLFSADVWILWIANTALQAAVVWFVSRRQLRPYFSHFQLYLALALLLTCTQMCILQLFPKQKNLYGYIFVYWSYLSTILEFLAIREVSASALARFPAIRAASSRTLFAFWGVIIAVGVAWYFYLASSSAEKFPFLVTALKYHDAASVGFTLYILLFLVFITWMPVPLHRSLMNHTFLLTCYFIAMSLSRFVVSVGKFESQQVIANYISLGGSATVFLFWILRVNSVPDETLNTPAGPLNAEEAKRLMLRLEDLNASLSRSATR